MENEAGRDEQTKKISYDIMNELKPKEPANDVTPQNKILESDDLQQRVVSKGGMDADEVNQMGFMNTNGAEISHILKNPNDVSHNMTNLDILDMPSDKQNLVQRGPAQISEPVSEKMLPESNANKPVDLGIEDPFGDFGKTQPNTTQPQGGSGQYVDDQKEVQPAPVDNQQAGNNIGKDTPLDSVTNPQGGFDDIFDDNLGMTEEPPKSPLEDPLQMDQPAGNQNNVDPLKADDPPDKQVFEEPQKKNEQESAEPGKNVKKLDMKKSDEYSGDDQYYSPDYYQDTGGYEDDGGDNYFQNNYYGDGSDYEEEDEKDYETYKRDETVKEGKPTENKNKDAADFL